MNKRLRDIRDIRDIRAIRMQADAASKRRQIPQGMFRSNGEPLSDDVYAMVNDTVEQLYKSIMDLRSNPQAL